MIVRNEEHTLSRCLDSIRDAVEEIVIVDTGSTDRTKEVAARYTSRIYDFEWTDDFAAARNYSFDQATLPYQMWLDADDIVLPADIDKLRALKASLPPDVDAVIMDYVLERDALGSAQNMTRRHRLFKRANHYRWVGPIHEYVPVQGKVLKTDIEITHAPLIQHKDLGRNLRILRQFINRESDDRPSRYHFYLANELLGLGQAEEAEQLYLSFLASQPENFEDLISACGSLSHLYHYKQEKDKELQYLFKTFQYARPRADYCTRIGSWFQEIGRFDLAVFWHELALLLGEPNSESGLINKAGWTWGPHVQLAVCYGKIGQLQAAYEHNEKALAYFPTNPVLLDNKRKLQEAMRLQQPSAPAPATSPHREQGNDSS